MTYNVSIGFGAGQMFLTPAQGGGPVRIGILQEPSLDMSFDEKPLYGQNQWAVAIARGKAKGSVKAKFAQIDSGAIVKCFLGVTPIAGQDITTDLEPGAVPNAGPYTVQVLGHTHWTTDLGVVYATTGQPLTAVAPGSEAAGKYSVAAGTYTFAAADANAAVLISYQQNDTTTGFKSTMTNQPMGTAVYFQTDLFQSNPEVTGQQWGLRCYRCHSSKMTLPFKQDDWTIPEMESSIQANAAGKVMDFNTPN